mgnify:CR=1 FL=1
MNRQRLSRVGHGLIILVCILLVAQSALAGQPVQSAASTSADGNTSSVQNITSSGSTSGVTIVTTQEFSGNVKDGKLLAFDAQGELIFDDRSYDTYFDVDPVPDRRSTVEYLGSHYLNSSECGGNVQCTRNAIVRHNLSTGERDVLYSRMTPRKFATRWHDADRINSSHYVIANLHRDTVFVVDTERNLTTWRWDAQKDLNLSSGGPYPKDWTHVNDVDVVGGDTYMISLRNQNQIVFVHRNGTLLENRTLNPDSDGSVIRKQHNPDYLKGSNGTRSVIVADSNNDRIAEFERTNSSWDLTWTWQDDRLGWPRDADRLPNGHTLITDTAGNRVVEIDEEGEVVWEATVPLPYEAERLGTGDESEGGEPATQLPLATTPASDQDSRSGNASSSTETGTSTNSSAADADPSNGGESGGSNDGKSLKRIILDALPQDVITAVAFALPAWMNVFDVAYLLIGLSATGSLALTELYFAGFRASVRSPVSVSRK